VKESLPQKGTKSHKNQFSSTAHFFPFFFRAFSCLFVAKLSGFFPANGRIGLNGLLPQKQKVA